MNERAKRNHQFLCYNRRIRPPRYCMIAMLHYHKLLEKNNEEYFIVEPNITEHKVFKLTDYNEATKKADIIVFLVAHNEFKNLEISEEKVTSQMLA